MRYVNPQPGKDDDTQMIASMTGYGRAEAVLHGRSIAVEIKSVNSRYFEYSSRMPRAFAFLEERLKKLVNEKVARGKVELSVTAVSLSEQETKVAPNLELAKQYLSAMREMGQALGLSDDVTVSVLARQPDVFVSVRAEQEEQALWELASETAQRALDAFLQMRRTEGEKLKEDIESRLCTIEKMVGEVERDSEQRVKAYTERLYERLKAVLGDRTIDEARVLTEAAVFADKTAVDEETVRLRSHIKQYREILQKDEPVGRKLDFLTQELNRETNTIGSKCSDLEITKLVVEIKAEIEKIREQVQNME